MNAQKIENECYSVSKEMLLLSRKQNRLIRSDLAVLVKVMMNKREAETVPLIKEYSILVKNSDLTLEVMVNDKGLVDSLIMNTMLDSGLMEQDLAEAELMKWDLAGTEYKQDLAEIY